MALTKVIHDNEYYYDIVRINIRNSDRKMFYILIILFRKRGSYIQVSLFKSYIFCILLCPFITVLMP